MKKLLFLTFTVALLSATSCKKNYTCTCIDSDDGRTETHTLPKSSKSDAELNCAKSNYIGYDYTTTCTVD